jgi:hypothetical protein
MSRIRERFDAVAMMRVARDRLSKQIEGMTLEEELRWLASQPQPDQFLARLRDRAAGRAARRADEPHRPATVR